MKRKIITFLKYFMVIFLCFNTEIKVRASASNLEDYSIINQKGFIEVEKQTDGSLDIQTFQNASLKIQYSGATVALKENTFVSVGKRLQIHFGVAFIQSKESGELAIHTKQGIIKSSKDTIFTISVNKERTLLAVLMGEAKIDDRIQPKGKTVRAGYQAWIGGLTSSGKKIVSGYEPINIDQAEQNYVLFSQQDDIAKKVALDYIKISWKKATDDIARQTQDEINGSMELLAQWEEENKKRELASIKEKKRIKEQFRAHALDLPYQNTEDPSE